MRIHFLGTSAGVPTLRRGLPAVAVEREGDLLLFDCGEGTQMALQRSPAKASRLAGIFVTHLHGDHVMGLPGLLMSLQTTNRTEPLPLVGTPGLKELVETTLRLLGVRLAYEVFVREVREPETVFCAEEYVIAADMLDHRTPCFGYAIREHDRPGRFDLAAAEALGVPKGPLYGKLQRGEPVTLEDGRTVTPDQVLGPARRGRRVAYVSDTRPCAGGVRLAEDADLLIHEATFEAGWEEEARMKGHSTVGDAADVAHKCGARALALTHFSSRYETTDELLKQARSRFNPVWLAEDGMVIEADIDGNVTSVTGRRGKVWL